MRALTFAAALLAAACTSYVPFELRSTPATAGAVPAQADGPAAEPGAQQAAEPAVEVPPRGEDIVSMGQPRRWQPFVGALGTWDTDEGELGGELLLGVDRPIGNPLFGAMGLAGEAFGRALDGDVDGGLRLFATSRTLFLQAGAEWLVDAEELDFVLSTQFPLRRGGLFGRGDFARIDWIPERDELRFGISLPIGQPWRGRTRPRDDSVELPRAPRSDTADREPTAELSAAAERLARLALRVQVGTTPFFDQEEGSRDEERRVVERYTRELAKQVVLDESSSARDLDRTWHRSLDEAFGLAVGGDTELGRAVADIARDVLLEDVILPYDRLLGQRKQRDSLLGLGAAAAERFRTRAAALEDLAPAADADVAWLFDEVVRALEACRARERETWGTSMLVWIPLRLALLPEDHDQQSELDTLLERATGERFWPGNDVNYVFNQQFQYELLRQIHSARDYHVLWIHDYRGRTPAGRADLLGAAQTVGAYIDAMTERVRAYDETLSLPVYLVFIDQIYYESNNGRMWLTLLEDPLRRDFETGDPVIDVPLAAALEELRAAVAGSRRLQAGRERWGDDWLRRQVRVHVNVTNPGDPTFGDSHLIAGAPWVPDTLMRDHRKIAFYDVTEREPARGEAIFTGMGVGQHYVGPTWVDRGVLVRGPSLVSLKDAARELLLSQGFRESQIPPPLRPMPQPSDWDEQVAALEEQGWFSRVLHTHNQTGYAQKDANVAKTLLYELMPPGSAIVAPDSLWNSTFWGGVLTGAALRGVHVYVIAPSLANAPSAGFPQMSRANEVLGRLIIARDVLAPAIARGRGALNVGVYDNPIPIGDMHGAVSLLAERARTAPAFRGLFPFNDETYELIGNMPALAEEMGYAAEFILDDEEPRLPKLHMKNQLFVGGEAAREFFGLDVWPDVVRALLEVRAREISFGTDREKDNTIQDMPSVKAAQAVLLEHLLPATLEWLDRQDPEELDRMVLYLTTGSQNQDYRGMLMDGEVLLVLRRWAALMGYLDFLDLVGTARWVQTTEELDELIPPYTGFQRWVGRFIKRAL